MSQVKEEEFEDEQIPRRGLVPFQIVKELVGSLVLGALALILGFNSFVQKRFRWAGQGHGDEELTERRLSRWTLSSL